MTDPIKAALAAEPDLQWLARFTVLGWRWLQPTADDAGITQIHAVRTWAANGSGDVLRIRSATDAQATRTNADGDGDIVWTVDGTMMDIVQAVLDLPEPSHPQAPRRVLRRMP